MLVGLPAELQAQDTTYIGGGGGPDGQRVIVNMDAIDGGTAPQRYQTPDAAQRDQDFTGQMVEGPKGVFLRFPPRTAPRSHLTVDPDELGDLSETDQAAAQAPPLTPPDQQRGATQAERTPPKPTTRPQQQPQPVVEETLTPSQPEPDPEQLQATAEPQTTATPTEKPTAPEPSAESSQASAESAETGTMPSPPPPPSETDMAEAEAEAPAPTPPQQKPAQPTVAQAKPEPEPAASDTAPQVAEQQPEPTPITTPEAAPSEPAAEDAAEPQPEAEQPEPETTQTARLPEQGLPEQVRLDFGSGSAELGEQQKEMLDALADRLKQNERQRIQLMAFAEGTEETASRARRLSLSRALAVRSYLIDQGIRSTRMDVRALGNTADSGPLDRVDIVPASR